MLIRLLQGSRKPLRSWALEDETQSGRMTGWKAQRWAIMCCRLQWWHPRTLNTSGEQAGSRVPLRGRWGWVPGGLRSCTCFAFIGSSSCQSPNVGSAG